MLPLVIQLGSIIVGQVVAVVTDSAVNKIVVIIISLLLNLNIVYNYY